MEERPSVSAIMIFLNGERFIEEAIESVLAQTYTGWELLLVDDGSTDGSTALALAYAARHPGRIRYLEHAGHQNLGMSATRNLGIHHARGRYIAFLDADDVWLPQKLAQQVAALEAHPEAGMIYAPTEYWYSWSGDPADRGRDSVPPLGLPRDVVVPAPTPLLRFLQNRAKPPGTCSVLLRREVVAEVGGFVEAFRGMFEDQAFFAKVCLHAPIYVLGEHSARYRQHPGSHCHITERASGYEAAEERYLRWLAGYVERYAGRKGEEWRELRRLLGPYRPSLRRLASDARRAAARALLRGRQ
ncbi:MAG TPA: glycosyltransferase family A protein [Chloroflexaceae bacterium]|nr:glycosyltransferase family A protein [Chloroflexaceae bacterium]